MSGAAALKISVVIPTFRRTELLKRAVESVVGQTLSDWELIISDDEVVAGETWAYLLDLQSKDPRVRVTRNPGPHGQAGNVNHCLQMARGEWIKPLFDDDVLLPECLEAFDAAVSRFPRVVLAGCLAKHFRNGQLVKTDRAPTRKPIEIVEQRHAHLAMYLQDSACGGMPTQMLIRRSAIERGAVMPDDPRFVSAIDQLWFADILKHGDRLHLAAVLVEEHQGGCATVTSGSPRDRLDQDNLLLRDYLYPLLPNTVDAPSLVTIRQMVLGIRGLHRLATGHIREGCTILLMVRSWTAFRLIMKWLLRKALPGYFTATPRQRFERVQG